jgi:hypothetical protein
VTALGNVEAGIAVGDNAVRTTIGADPDGNSNVVAFNGSDGIKIIDLQPPYDTSGIPAPVSVSIYRNSIHSNGEIGINITTDYPFVSTPDPNDVGDADGGPNNGQNYPIIQSVVAEGANTRITGHMNSVSNATIALQFYDNTSCGPQGHGQGQTYIGSHVISTDGEGNRYFTVTLPWTYTVGHAITATATRSHSISLNDTSEFSPCPGPAVDSDGDGVPDATDNCAAVPNVGQAHSDRNFIDQTPPSTQDDRTVANSDQTGDDCDMDDDNDGRSDSSEVIGGCTGPSDPTLRDTDGDRFLDGAECALGTDPGDAGSKPLLASCAAAGDGDGDKIQDRVEVCHYNTSGSNVDTDGDQDGSPSTGLTKDGCEIVSLNNDRLVNAADQLLLASAISTPFYLVSMDVNKDGGVNAGDQLIMASLISPGGQCP